MKFTNNEINQNYLQSITSYIKLLKSLKSLT